MKKYLFKYKWLLTGSIFFISIKSIFNILIAVLLKMMLDVGASGRIDKLKTVCIYFIIFSVLEPVICYLKDLFKSNYIQNTLILLKNDIFNKLLITNISKFNRQNTAEYISILTNDITIIEQDYFESIFSIIADLGSFILGTIALLSINVYITIIIFSLGISVLVIPMIFGKKLSIYKKFYSDNLSNFTTKIKDIFSGFEVIKSFNIENKVNDDFKKSNYNVEYSKKKYKIVNSIADNISGFAGGLMFLGSLLVGCYFVIKGDMTIGSAMATTQLVNNIVIPMTSMTSYVNKIKSIKLINDKIYNSIKEDKNYKKEVDKKSFNEKIIFDKVTFSYNKDKNILNEFSMEFKKGKKYAIVGPSGSGKSTLIKLLLGYYDNYTGSIKIDGIDVLKFKSDSLYKLISMIHQNVFMFDNTIEENITLSNDYDENVIKKTIDMAGLHNLVNDLSKGSHSTVGENGNKLSGGEKQRVAIARALIKNTPIIILDEATSALDNETATNIEKSLLSLEDLTCIVVTHKLIANILNKYDEIIVLKNGKVCEVGSFDQLMDNKDYFYSLYSITES